MDWSTAEDLEDQVRRLWDRGRLLDGGAVFPLPLRLRRPDSAALSDRFDEVRRWIRGLEAASKAHRGHGYELEWIEIDHRRLGRNRVPSGAFVPTRADALRLVGKQRQAERVERLAAITRAAFPQLEAWIAKKPMTLLEHERDWERILAILAWFRDHPRPGIYLRQVDVAGVDTKFIETRKGLLMDLLDTVLAPHAIDESRHFETRYHLRSKPALVRFRILDERHRLAGLSDIAVPACDFAELNLGVRRIFITENEINGLAFPEARDAAVIFGLGYGLDRLADVDWLKDKQVVYWGDIDTHGFAILDRLRATFPSAVSLLMDEATLLQHRSSWVRETSPHVGALPRLTPPEQRVLATLRDGQLGDCIRLEQERIGFGWVRRALDALDDA
jgi:hypothetical protein